MHVLLHYAVPMCRMLLALALACLSASFSSPALAAPLAHSADRDCADFSNQAQAQIYFIDQGGPSSDPDRLDGDGDGMACDSLPCPCSSDRGEERTEPRRRALVITARVTSVVTATR